MTTTEQILSRNILELQIYLFKNKTTVCWYIKEIFNIHIVVFLAKLKKILSLN